jgi:hypothetical protein
MTFARLLSPIHTLRAFFSRGDVLADAHIYGGLLVASVGGWQIDPRWTLIALGCALMAIPLVATWKRGRTP